MDNTICHFEIPAADMPAALEFYRSLFGWKIVPVPGMEEQYFVIQTTDRPDSLGGGIHARESKREGVTLYVMVESVDESAGKVEELGGTVLAQKSAIESVGWVATVQDPQGNVIGLFQEDKEAQ